MSTKLPVQSPSTILTVPFLLSGRSRYWRGYQHHRHHCGGRKHPLAKAILTHDDLLSVAASLVLCPSRDFPVERRNCTSADEGRCACRSLTALTDGRSRHAGPGDRRSRAESALAPCVEEEMVMAGDRPDREPVPQCRAGLLPQWQHALAPPPFRSCARYRGAGVRGLRTSARSAPRL